MNAEKLEKLTEKNGCVIVCWPESQELMNKSGFEDNSALINDEEGLDMFGYQAYVVSKDWIDNDFHSEDDEDYDSEYVGIAELVRDEVNDGWYYTLPY